MNNILQTLLNAYKLPDIRKKIVFTFIMFLIFRLFAHLPIPGIDTKALALLFKQNQFLGLLDIFSGGTLVNFSVMALGLNPYINSSIIFQLLTMVFPQLEALSKEGEYGRQKINQYTRMLTVPLSLLQAFGMYALLRNQNIIPNLNFIYLTSMILAMSAGTLILMWIGELISEKGIGNGISLLIFAGIVGRLPVIVFQTTASWTPEKTFNTLIFVIMSLFVIAAIVVVNEAVRQVTVAYAKRIRGNRMYGGEQTHLPLRVNQAGVIPIIFAVSLILLPNMIGQFLSNSPTPLVSQIARTIASLFDPNGFFYNLTYFLLVIGFTYFYTAVTFNPVKIAGEIQKYGGFIPGIRPGSPTASYLNYILTRITLAGALFLGLIAILPFIAKSITGVTTMMLGGTGILIVVSVVLETTKKLESMLLSRNYDSFIKK